MDQPQPMSMVLSIPVHGVVVHILVTFQCHVLSCPQDLEFGGLSDASIQRPCGEGDKADVTDTTERLRVGTLRFSPRKETQDLPACRRQNTTQHRRLTLMAGAGLMEGSSGSVGC